MTGEELTADALNTDDVLVEDPRREMVVTFSPEGGAERRHRFRPAEGSDTYIRTEEVRDYDGEWRPVGTDVVADVILRVGEHD